MIRSMTAFGRGRYEGEEKTFTVEIRSVNSRYLDASVKLPRAYAFLEEKVKGYVQGRVTSRGKVDVAVSVENRGKGNIAVELDEGLLEGYIQALSTLRDTYGLKDDITVMGVARLPDVFRLQKQEEDVGEDWALLEVALDEAATEYAAMRDAEGVRLAEDLRSKAAKIKELVAEIAALSEKDIAAYRTRLEEKLRAVLADQKVTPDENRILTECAIVADRLCIDEELVRLGSHLKAFDEMLDANEPVGRRLDFLMQEMNREINTTGSKCANSDIAHLVVAVKCELEKIREQIQNIE
ncbi:MAG: YicC family protein [Clostridia bacterium]|nr:YicC family protein [Clostridia bacterium]